MQLINSKMLSGEDVYLRDIQLTDVTAVYAQWLNDPVINQFMETRFYQQSLDSIKEFVQAKKDSTDELLLAICTQMDQRHVGNIKIGPINRMHQYADISYFIGDKACWGKGLATQAISLVVQYAFAELKLHKVTAGCYAPNIGSIKALQKAGFVIEGEFPRHYLYNNEYINKICLGLINDNAVHS